MNYIYAMGFLTWVITIWMLIGMVGIIIMKIALRFFDIDSVTQSQTEAILMEFHSRDFAGKVAFLLFVGAMATALPFKFNKKEK
ncbi:hypothetical protein IEN91_05465 [Bacillus velezensis]|uniref:hypothetical protein n=1 Tax=Bacillus velezensis TaxID=492670 RepID=UPI0018C4CD2B|nr:hypothetical protein [Bacillus velezensis]QPK89888.1 hypothetical protein IEN91_05465 [Bacillus velezensis]